MDDQIIFRFRKGEDGVFRSFIVRRGSQDGQGAGDRDQPYEGLDRGLFDAVTLRRLLRLRGKVHEARARGGPYSDDLRPGQDEPQPDDGEQSAQSP